MGRPTKEPRKNYTGIRMSDAEIEKLDFCVDKTGKSKTDILMMGLDIVFEELKEE